MQITLNTTEVTTAIESYLRTLINLAPNTNFSIEIVGSRGEHKVIVDVTTQQATAVVVVAESVPKKSTPQPKVAEVTPALKEEEEEPKESKPIAPVVEPIEPTTEEAPKASTGKHSLFNKLTK